MKQSYKEKARQQQF